MVQPGTLYGSGPVGPEKPKCLDSSSYKAGRGRAGREFVVQRVCAQDKAVCLSETRGDHGATAAESDYLHTFNDAGLLPALSSEEAWPLGG